MARIVYACVLLLAVVAASVAQDPGLDLPICDPKDKSFAYIATPTATTDPVPPPPPDEEDPRDEPPPVFFGEEIYSENSTIVYVLDCSGSMGTDRLMCAKREIVKSISALSANFRFNVVYFGCSVFKVMPDLVQATPENKNMMSARVIQLGDGGGTGTGPAVATALANKEVMSVVLLTDGEPNCGAWGDEGHRSMIRNNNTQGATIDVFGIDAWGDYRSFCTNVAADSGGSYFDLTID